MGGGIGITFALQGMGCAAKGGREGSREESKEGKREEEGVRMPVCVFSKGMY